MKKAVLSILAFGIGFSFAQNVITSADAPVVGDIEYQSNDDFPSITVDTTAGGGKVWDFSGLESDYQTVSYYITPAGTPGDTSFPTANLVMRTDSTFTYLQSGALELRALGNYSAATPPLPAVTNKMNPTRLVVKFPSTYMTAYKDTSGFKTTFYFGQNFGGQQIDSVRITNRTYRDVIFDAYGDITTPEGLYTGAVKARELTESYDTIEAYIAIMPGFGFWQPFQETKTTTLGYTWYSNSLHFPVASAVLDSTRSSVEYATYYFTGPVTMDDLDTTNINTAKTIYVGGNDFVVGPGTAAVIDAPANGSAVVLNADSIVYTPNTGFTGTDYFSYSLCKTGTNKCDTAIVLVEVLGPNAVRMNEVSGGIRVYPNPSSEMVNLEFGNDQRVTQVIVTDLLGKKVEDIRLNGEEKIQVNVSGYKKGIYLIQASGSKGEILKTGKITVIK